MRPQVACLLLLLTTAFAAKDSSEDFDIENIRESEWASLDEDQAPAPTNDNQQAIKDALENYIKERQKNTQQSNVPSNSFTLNAPQSGPSFSAQLQQQNTPFTFDTSSLQQPQFSQGNFDQQNRKPGLELFVNKPPLSHSNVAQLLNQPQLSLSNPTFTTLNNRQQQGTNIPLNSNPQFSEGSLSQNLNQQQFNPNSQSFVPGNIAQQFSQQNFAPFSNPQNIKQGSRVQFLDSPQSGQNQFSSQQSQFAPNIPANTFSLLSGNYAAQLSSNTAYLQDAPPKTNTPPKKDEHVIDIKDFLNYLQNNDAEEGAPSDKDPPNNPNPSSPPPPPPADPAPTPNSPSYPQDLHNPESFLLKDTAEYMIARDNNGKPILLSDVEENGNIPTHMDYNQYAPAASTQVYVNALANGKFENVTKEQQDSQYFDLLNVQSNGKFEKINEIKQGSTFIPDFTSKRVTAPNSSQGTVLGSQQYFENSQDTFTPSNQKTIQQIYDTPSQLQSQHTTAEISKVPSNVPTTGHFLGNGPSTSTVSNSGQQGPFILQQSELFQVTKPEVKNLERSTTVSSNNYATVQHKDISQGTLNSRPQDFYVDFTVTQTEDNKKTTLNPSQVTLENINQQNPTNTQSFFLRNVGNILQFKSQLSDKAINSDDFSQIPDFLYDKSYHTKEFETPKEKLKEVSDYHADKNVFASVQQLTTSDLPGTVHSFANLEKTSNYRTQNNPKENEGNLKHDLKTTKALASHLINANSKPKEQTFYEKLRQAMSKTETTTSGFASFGTTVPLEYFSNTAPSTLLTKPTPTATTVTNNPPTEYFTTLSNFPVTDFITTKEPSTVQLTTSPYTDKFTTFSPRPLTDKVTTHQNFITTDTFTTTSSSTPEKFTTSTRPSTDRFTTGSDNPDTKPFITIPNNPTSTNTLTTVNPSLLETSNETPTSHIPTTTSESFTGDGEQGLPSYNIPGLPLLGSVQQSVNYVTSNQKPLQDSIIPPSQRKAPLYTNTWLKNNYLSNPIDGETKNTIKSDTLSKVELLKKPFLNQPSNTKLPNVVIVNNSFQNVPPSNYGLPTNLLDSQKTQSDFLNFQYQNSHLPQNQLTDIFNAPSSSYNVASQIFHPNIQSSSHYSNTHYISPTTESNFSISHSINLQNSLNNKNNLVQNDDKPNVLPDSAILNNQYINSQINKFSNFQSSYTNEINQQKNPYQNNNSPYLHTINSQTKPSTNRFSIHGSNFLYRPISDYNYENIRGPYRPNNLYDNFDSTVKNEANKNVKPHSYNPVLKNENKLQANLYGYVNVPNSLISNEPLTTSAVKNSKITNKQKEQDLHISKINNNNIPHLTTDLKNENTFVSNANIMNLQNKPHSGPFHTNLHNLNTNNEQNNINLYDYFNIPNIPLTESTNLNTQYTQLKPNTPFADSENLNSEIYSYQKQPPTNYNNYNVHNNVPSSHLQEFPSNSNIFTNPNSFKVPNENNNAKLNTQYLNIRQYPISDYGNFNAQTSLSIQEQRPIQESNYNRNYVLASSQNYQQSPSLSKPIFISSTNGFYPNAPNHVLLTSQNPAHNHDLQLHAQNNSPLAPGQQPVALNDSPGPNVPQGYATGQLLQVQNFQPGQNGISQQGYNINIPSQYQPLVQSDTPIIPGFNAVEAFEKEDLTPVYLPADNCSAVFQVLEDRQSVLGVRALPGSADCRITFTSPNTSRLAMQVLGLDLPQGENACTAASISVFSQRDGRNMLLNQLCGEVKESPVMLTEGQSALVTVQSEAGIERPGFTIVAFLW